MAIPKTASPGTMSQGLYASSPERERKEIILPSGRSITVLETTGEAERLLSSIQRNQDLSAINRFLTLVTEDLDGKKGKPTEDDFKSMLTGDRTFILLNARKLTHGTFIEFKMHCPGCAAKSDHELNLDDCLNEMKPYPKGDGREFSVNVGPGTIHFELSTGETELKIAKIKNPEINTKFRCMRMWEETENGKLPINLDVLKSNWIAELRKAVKEAECKLDTLVQIQCPGCGAFSNGDMMGNLDFLFPHST